MQFSPKELKQKLSEGLDDDYNVRTSDKKRKITVLLSQFRPHYSAMSGRRDGHLLSKRALMKICF